MNGWRPWQHVLLGFILGTLVVFGTMWVTAQPRGTPVVIEPLPTAAPIQVHIAGAVQEPGLYSFSPGSRASEAIKSAGGLTAEADPDAVNLAAVLRDGMQLYIPRRGETQTPALTSDRASLLDLNTAGLDDLQQLPGIGPERAQDILTYREQHGGFQKIEELMEIPGIGETTFARLKPLVTLAP
jgi:competence protein ComEA